jgi:hypothetical protein
MDRFARVRQRHGFAIASTMLGVLAGFAACARAPKDPQQALARELVERIAAAPHEVAWEGDTLVEPTAAVALVRMGSTAVPVLLDAVLHRDDAWVRSIAIEVLGRIGDVRGRPALEQMLVRSHGPGASRDHFDDAVAALGRLASPASLPLLRAQLATVPRSRRIAVLDAIRRCGDTSVIGEVLHLGYTDPEVRNEAIRVLEQHPPLRRALGLTDERGCYEDDQFLKAASEWHHEDLLGKPLPWRPWASQFTEPFATVKEAAFAALEEHVGKDQEFGRLRVYPIDPKLTDEHVRRDLTLITGYGHSHGLSVHLWCAEQDPVVGYRLTFSNGSTRSASRDDSGGVRCTRMTLARDAYAGVIAGMHTMLTAKLTRWWDGPEQIGLLSTADFVVAVGGMDVRDTSPRRYCGYPATGARIQYAALEAAAAWHRERIAERVGGTAQAITEDIRRRFAALFVAEQSLWNSDWWWVRERMVAMAGYAGDRTLLRPLATYLQPKFARGESSELRTATAAIHALAALTGSDLRFAADGRPRPIAEAAEAYLALLAR